MSYSASFKIIKIRNISALSFKLSNIDDFSAGRKLRFQKVGVKARKSCEIKDVIACHWLLE